MSPARAARPPAPVPPVAHRSPLPPHRAVLVPLAFTTALVGLSALPAIRGNQRLLGSFWGAAIMLLAGIAILFATARRRPRTLVLEIALRPQHYLQACAHTSILLYWGWYWREVYDAAPLIAGQLAFAFAFDALLAWSRRDSYTLGFGPFPIIFSTNLFLWFKPDWFYLQFMMVAVGFAAKELIRWTKDGRRTHIFNPSSFTLMAFSLGLIFTGQTGITWGPEIATTQLNPPHIYLWIFLVTLPAQLLFGVAPMTWAAVGTAYLCEVAYFAATGMHFFAERPIPIAVFLGMHLLFTDPSTSPRTELGRLIFGVLYGLGVVGLLALFTHLGVPTFYDKLLPVPALNLLIQIIDRVSRTDLLRRFDPSRLGPHLRPRFRNLAYMAVWALTFLVMQVRTGADAMLVRADSLFTQGRVDDAIARYRDYISRKPADAEGHNNLGVALMQAGHPDDAVASFRRANELRPESPSTLDNLGLALLRTGRVGEAVPLIQRAAMLQPGSAQIQEHLGDALTRAGRFDEAVASLRRAIDLAPRYAEAHADLGVVLMQTGKFADAVAALKRAEVLQPDSSETLNNLGVALMRAGNVSDAIAPLQRALTLQPENAALQDNLGQALMQSGRVTEAVAAFQHAVELQPTSPSALNSLGVALMQAGRVDDAIATLRRVVDLSPGSARSHDNLGVALMQAGRSEEAFEAFQRAVGAQPDDPEAHATLAEALVQHGRLKEAVPSFQRVVELRPSSAEAHYNLARAFAAVGQPRRSALELREALRGQPNSPQVLAALAWVEATEADAPRDPDDAVRLASRAAELSGRRDAHILDVLAASYAAQGRWEDASRTAEAAETLALTGSDAELTAQIRERLATYRRRSARR